MPVKKVAISIILVLILIAGFVAGLYLVRQQQDIREDASTPAGQATVSLLPATQSSQVGDTFKSSIYFNTLNIPVSSVIVKLTYPYTGVSPEVVASNLQINPSLTSTGDWSCATKSITEAAGVVSINVGCANLTSVGFATSTDTLLATFDMTVASRPATNPLIVRFDSVESKILNKSTTQDILAIPTSVGTYTVGSSGAAATATLTPTSRLTTTITPTSRLTTTLTPTTASSSATPTATTPSELMDSGFSSPTLIGIGLGLLAIFGSLAIAL